MNTLLSPKNLYWWSSSSGLIELRIPGECVVACSHSGDCGTEVDHWAPRILEQAEKDAFPHNPTPEKVREELRKHGAWTEEELRDSSANWSRLVWLACCDIADSDEPDCTTPLPWRYGHERNLAYYPGARPIYLCNGRRTTKERYEQAKEGCTLSCMSTARGKNGRLVYYTTATPE